MAVGPGGRAPLRAVQISRFMQYLDGLSPLLSIGMLAIAESGSGLGTMLSKLASAGSQGPRRPQVPAKSANFGPLVAHPVWAKAADRAAAVQISGIRKPNLDKPERRSPLQRAGMPWRIPAHISDASRRAAALRRFPV